MMLTEISFITRFPKDTFQVYPTRQGEKSLPGEFPEETRVCQVLDNRSIDLQRFMYRIFRKKF